LNTFEVSVEIIMAIKFQYNKTYLQQLNKELRVRENALPTLVAKESALRLEVQKAKQDVQALEQQLAQKAAEMESTYTLWQELPEGLVTVGDVGIDAKKIAGIKTPVLDRIVFSIQPFSLFGLPPWIPQGIEMLKSLVELNIKAELARRKVVILEIARKKTTQKVNLYEKVQIPEYGEAILKIKRFLEDEENLAKSSQKILKARLTHAEMAA
jgi:V/A-type H+/Na+-transporting ATPase subunit D